MYCWPSVWHYVHRYVVLILMDKSSSISWGRGVRGFWDDHIFFRGKGGESLPNRSWGGRWGAWKSYEPTNCQWKGIIRLQSLIGGLGKIYRDTNDILRKPPPPLDKLWSVPFSTLVVVNVGFSHQTKKKPWDFTNICFCCSELMKMFTHNWGRKMQIGCNDFSVGMLSVFLFVCFENSSFVHWNKVTFPRVRAHTSINCMY